MTYIIVTVAVFNYERVNSRAEKALKELKEQQDGDYFLTSLIIQPLFRNTTADEVIVTEQFASQKKKFFFKGRTCDLGGDINIINTLNFRGTKYTFFINADAMGKSMQGAGGAIVLGTVVNSILTRNLGVRIPIHPKEWLIKVFNELQEIFVEFDGYMLISCFVGLISNVSGKMYYFNCEHPSGIIYRDKKAEFLPGNPEFKIGTPMFGNGYLIPVFEYQLYAGDIIITGSDGRDDIMMSSEDGNSNINSDEKLFLQVVEEAEADIERIYQKLQTIGEIKDDLSLIKILYKRQNEEIKIYELDIKHIKNLILNAKYKDALNELESTEDESLNPELIYLRALCLERLGLGKVAFSLLEKKSILLEKHIPSYFLKAMICFRGGEFIKANEILIRCRKQNGDSLQLKKLLKKVEARLR